MSGETNLQVLIKSLKPVHNTGDYVFCVASDKINIEDVIMLFKEKEGTTIVIKKELADVLKISYSFVAAWITLSVHSSLEAVGLTAAFATALSNKNISCNVVAAFYHDHIFVDKKDAEKAMEILRNLSK